MIVFKIEIITPSLKKELKDALLEENTHLDFVVNELNLLR